MSIKVNEWQPADGCKQCGHAKRIMGDQLRMSMGTHGKAMSKIRSLSAENTRLQTLTGATEVVEGLGMCVVPDDPTEALAMAYNVAAQEAYEKIEHNTCYCHADETGTVIGCDTCRETFFAGYKALLLSAKGGGQG